MKIIPVNRRLRLALLVGVLSACTLTVAVIANHRVHWLAGRVYSNTIGRLFEKRVDLASANSRLRAILGQEASLPLGQPRVVIHKSEKRADLFNGDALVRTYPVAFGGSSMGAKRRVGDRRTPEGNYFICTRVPSSRFHLFLGLNYPNAEDAREATQSHLIDEETAQGIAKAELEKTSPDWTTAMGGAIGLHGGGISSNWTDGCIAFKNEDIEEMWTATAGWTPVQIVP
jgi:murein L,D-transpeptidase YafK